jgi:hypothetical protein
MRRQAKIISFGAEEDNVAEFSFVAPILPGKTDAWRQAVAEIKGARNAAYKESRSKLGIKREHVSLQSTPMGDMVIVHMDAPDQQSVIRSMMQGTSEFDTWFRETVLVGVHGFDPKAAPPPPVTVVLDYKG